MQIVKPLVYTKVFQKNIPVTAETPLSVSFQTHSGTPDSKYFLVPLHRGTVQFPNQTLHRHLLLLPQKPQKHLNVRNTNLLKHWISQVQPGEEKVQEKNACPCTPKDMYKDMNSPAILFLSLIEIQLTYHTRFITGVLQNDLTLANIMK